MNYCSRVSAAASCPGLVLIPGADILAKQTRGFISSEESLLEKQSVDSIRVLRVKTMDNSVRGRNRMGFIQTAKTTMPQINRTVSK